MKVEMNKKEFKEIDTIAHHGTTRYAHSVRVSYYAYKIAKKLRLDYVKVARAGLLHDFFMSSPDRTKFERMMSTFTHPKFACRNASSMFKLNNKEKLFFRKVICRIKDFKQSIIEHFTL